MLSVTISSVLYYTISIIFITVKFGINECEEHVQPITEGNVWADGTYIKVNILWCLQIIIIYADCTVFQKGRELFFLNGSFMSIKSIHHVFEWTLV